MTEVGAIYYQHCRQVLDGLADAERAITNLQSTPKGKLKITAPVTYGERSVAPLVNDFITRYPQLDVQLVLSNQQFDLVTEGFDLAIRLGQLGNSSMIAKRLATRTQYVCAAPSYLQSQGAPIPCLSWTDIIACRERWIIGVFRNRVGRAISG